LTKNERWALSLQQQSFKNYITFNIPISDLFRRKEESEVDKGKGVQGKLFFVNESALVHPDESIDLNGPDSIVKKKKHRSVLEQHTLSHQYQKKMKALLDEPDLRFQVA